MADNTIKIKFSATGDRTVIEAIQALDASTKKLIEGQTRLVKANRKSKDSNEKHKKAVEKLEIKLKALGLGFNNLRGGIELQTKALKGDKVALEKLTNSTKSYIATQNHADASTRILGGSFAVLRSRMLLFNFAMSLGIRQLIRFSSQTAKVQSMERAFNTLSGGSNNATEALIKLKKATNNTMSQFDLFKQANNAMLLGVSKNSDEMAEMFDIAQRLGNALGQDTASSVESLVTGIGRQSKLMLDNIGIMVRTKEAYEDYARVLNKSTESLTDAEKKTAFFNATMDSARLLSKLLSPEIKDNQQAFETFNASMSDLAMELGEALMPALRTLASLTESLSKNLNATHIRVFGEALLSVAYAFGVYKTAVIASTLATKKFTLSLLKNPIGIIAVALSAVTFAVLEYIRVVGKDIELTEEQIKQKKEHETNIKKMQDELTKLIKTSREENTIIEDSIELRDRLIKRNNTRLTNISNTILALKLEKGQLQGLNKLEIAKLKHKHESVMSGSKLSKKEKEQQALLFGLIEDEIKAIMRLTALKKEESEEEKKNQLSTKEAEEGKLKIKNDAEKAKKRILGDTLNYQLNELKILEDAFLKHNVHTLESATYFSNEYQKLLDNETQTTFTEHQKRTEILLKASQDQKRIHQENLDATAVANDAYQKTVETRNEVNAKALSDMQAIMQANNEQLVSGINSSLSALNGVLSAWKANMQARMDAELSTLKDSEKYKNADSERRKDLEREVTKGYAQEQLKQFRIGQASAIADIGMNTASALMSSVAGSWVTIGQPWFGIIASLGALQAGLVMSQKPPSFEKGGMVGGQRHSQGGTMIEAERGEFVMSRSAVQSVGVETLNQMNQGGGGGLTLNISAPLIDETIIDTIIPAIQKAQRMNLA
tara:strand:+ start:412 stop:3084 length:2673 start_codon:yes stop_codon:yes gene_type:complete